ncbi:hypothetical protein OH492_27885 [Vibrio chagasii]|nr:hypothetical protein [Vibrio chagasii]
MRFSQIKDGPKRVLIIGASSGFALLLVSPYLCGASQADTIGVSFERGPNENLLVVPAGTTTSTSKKKRNVNSAPLLTS